MKGTTRTNIWADGVMMLMYDNSDEGRNPFFCDTFIKLLLRSRPAGLFEERRDLADKRVDLSRSYNYHVQHQ
jgi:hypothetical protein